MDDDAVASAELRVRGAAVPRLRVGVRRRPESVARAERALWPEALDSTVAYNPASRAEILVFTVALAEVASLDEAGLKAELRIKSADVGSVQRVRERLVQLLLDNYRAASADCAEMQPFCLVADTPSALADAARAALAQVPAPYAGWLPNAQRFHRLYAGELVRLAALFPRVSS